MTFTYLCGEVREEGECLGGRGGGGGGRIQISTKEEQITTLLLDLTRLSV